MSCICIINNESSLHIFTNITWLSWIWLMNHIRPVHFWSFRFQNQNWVRGFWSQKISAKTNQLICFCLCDLCDQKNSTFFFVRENRITDRVTQFYQPILLNQNPIKNPNDQKWTGLLFALLIMMHSEQTRTVQSKQNSDITRNSGFWLVDLRGGTDKNCMVWNRT